jgi:hypothetical protein
MKKAIASPLCSAFVIPGLGQILNGELKKGLLVLGGVFLLFIMGVIKMVQLIRAIIQPGHLETLSPDDIMARIRTEDPTMLWVILAVFAVLWLYSVVDAFLIGRRIDMTEERPEP